MYYRHLMAGVSLLGLLLCGKVSAQTTTNNIDSPNNANSTANPVVDLNQQGSLVNTQVNTFPLGRTVVGNGVADCSSDGIAFSAFGNGIGPFDTGSIGGTFTYTHSFGVDTCRSYAKTQLAKSKLETCLLLISNYSKMVKAGVKVSYEALKQVAEVDCPAISVPKPGGTPFGATPNPANVNARRHQAQPVQQVVQQQAAPQQRPAAPPQAVPRRPAPQPQQRPATVQTQPQPQKLQAWQ